MFQKLLSHYELILASKSPRRQQFLIDLGLDHKVQTKDTDESFPKDLQAAEITKYLAIQKAKAFGKFPDNKLLITSDTIVWDGKKALGKPKDRAEALEILRSLSGKKHETISSICITNAAFQKTADCVTEVWFKDFSDAELEYYVDNFKPFDKAGSYGIQEWIGMIGVEKMSGSFYNVMGLPTHLLYKLLQEIENEIS